MRRRLMIIFTSISLLVCISLLTYNVFAMTSQSFSIFNQIGFIADKNIYVALECSVRGCQQDPSLFNHQVVFDPNDENNPKNQGIKQDLDSETNRWYINESLKFRGTNKPIYYDIVVHNYSDMKIKVTIVPNDTSNKVLKQTISKDLFLPGYSEIQGAKFDTITLTTEIADCTKSLKGFDNGFKVIFKVIED